MTDLESLVAPALAGDGRALNTLCRGLEPPIYRLCVRMLGDVRDAEDATQDVLVKVVTHLAQFEGRARLTTWAHQIAVRHVLQLRASRAEQRALGEDALAELLEQGLAYGQTQPPPSPEDHGFITEVRLSCTQGMLMMLSRDERLALVLVELLGFDGAEAAEICQVEPATLRQRLTRARQRLGEFVARRCGLAGEGAPCRCEGQVAGKRARQGSQLRWAPLAGDDLPARDEVEAAYGELVQLRRIQRVYRPGGVLVPPESLHARLTALLPTVLHD